MKNRPNLKRDYRMTSVVILTLVTLLLAVGGASAQTSKVFINGVTKSYPTGTISDTKLIAGEQHQFEIWLDGTGLTGNWIMSMSWDIYGDADWQFIETQRAGLSLRALVEGGTLDFQVTPFNRLWHKTGGTGDYGPATDEPGLPSVTSGPVAGNITGIDTVGHQLGMSAAGDFGWNPGEVPSDTAMLIKFASVAADHGKFICIDTQTNVGTWEWAAGLNFLRPDWDNGLGENTSRCWEVVDTSIPDLGTLVVDPVTLSFEATLPVEPPSQTFGVSEQGGNNVPYVASTSASWIVLSNANNTTPNDVTVDIILSGLSVGSFTDSILVESEGTTNSEYVVVNLNVLAGNSAPVLAAIGPKPGFEGQLLSFTVNGYDNEGDSLIFSIVGLPTGASFTDNFDGSADFDWTPDFDQADTYPVTVTVSDGDLTDDETFNIEITNVNRIPTLDPIGSKLVSENSNLDFVVTASDPDDDPLTLSADPLPSGATFTGGVFDWTPVDGQADTYNVWFVASDGTDADSELVEIVVQPDLEFAFLQLVHNSADTAAAVVDIWVNGSVFEDNFAFRTATAFRSVQAGVDLTVGVSGPNDPAPVVEFSPLNLTADMAYIVVANGLLTPGDYQANPDGRSTALTVFVKNDAQRTGTSGANVDLYVLHGATDAPTVDIIARGVTTLANDAAYGDATAYLSLPAASYILDLTPGNDNADILASFDASVLAAAGGRAAVAFASGFFTPDDDNEGAEFGLFAALDDGTVIEFPLIVPELNLAVDPTSIAFEVSEGDLMMPEKVVDVTEVGGESIGFQARTVLGNVFFVGDSTGLTPSSFTVSPEISGLDPDVYIDTIIVTAEDAANTPVKIPVTITVNPCPFLNPVLVNFNRMTFEGELVEFTDSFTLVSSGPGDIAWEQTTLSDYITLDPDFGTTPTEIDVSYSRTFPDQGVFADTVIIASVFDEGTECFSSTYVVVNVTVNAPPSADTVFVVNTPAVPGMKVSVPVQLSNSCLTSGFHVSMNWFSDDLYLESVSFDGSVFDVASSSADIDNNINQVGLNVSAGDGMYVAIGSKQPSAWLNFTLTCEIADGIFPISLTDADTGILIMRDCGEGEELEFPIYLEGNIIVGSASNFVCGYVVDPLDNEIEGATVELYADFPSSGVEMTTFSSFIGSYAFDGITSIPFDLYAYKEGYYPGKVEDVNFGEKGVKIVLTPIEQILVPTSQWVDYFCPDSSSTFFGYPLQPGAVVEAYTQGGLLVGQKMVTEVGKYGFMPVYRASEEFSDDGAVTGDNISFYVNNMAAIATGNTIYPADYEQVAVCLEVRGVVTKDCELLEGWNLISWNVDTDTDAIETILGPHMDCIEVVLGFERGGLTYDPELPEFSTLWYVDHLSGYWIKVKQGCQVALAIEGLPISVSTPIPVYAGWNLVSYLPELLMTPTDALLSLEETLLYAYGWDNEILIYQPGAVEFNTLVEMMTCNGYWVKVSADDELIYPNFIDMISDGPIASSGGPAYRGNPQAVAGSSSDPNPISTPNWVNLYSRNLSVNGIAVASGTSITAHAESGEKVGSFVIGQSGRFGFMPVYAGDDAALKPGQQFYLEVDGEETDERFEWTSNGARIEITSLSAANSSGAALPNEYSLDQNYPNPFNPATNISFTMGANGRAKLQVFNILGALIAIPFDGQAVAGENTVIWDGRDESGQPVASGVYLYRLSADNYSETKKMMLLK